MRIISAAVLLLFSLTAGAQQWATSYKTTEVSPGIHMVEGVGGFGGGNMAVLVGEDMVAMIDNGMPTPELSDMLMATVEETTGGRAVEVMINTHVHGDHAGGNTRFASGGTVIMTHHNIRKRLLDDPSGAGGEAGIPMVTYGAGIELHLGGIEAKVMHLPSAHTDGDSFVHFPSANVIHMGDIFFHKIFPFIDLDSGGSVSGYIAAMEKIWAMANDETTIIPGHGPIATKASLREDIDMLIDSRDTIKAMIDDGKSGAEILAANPLAEKYSAYNWSFITLERMTETFLRDLKAGN